MSEYLDRLADTSQAQNPEGLTGTCTPDYPPDSVFGQAYESITRNTFADLANFSASLKTTSVGFGMPTMMYDTIPLKEAREGVNPTAAALINTIKGKIGTLVSIPQGIADKLNLAFNNLTKIPEIPSIISQLVTIFPNVPEYLIYAIATQESGFDPGAQSGAGAKGIMQVMPSVMDSITRFIKKGPVRYPGADEGFYGSLGKNETFRAIFDSGNSIHTNLAVGVALFSRLLNKHKTRIEKTTGPEGLTDELRNQIIKFALMEYNGGPGGPQSKAIETIQYPGKILKYADILKKIGIRK